MYRSIKHAPSGSENRGVRPEELRQGIFDAVEDGEAVADIIAVKAAVPAWKKPPQIQISLDSLSLSDEILADRDGKR